MTYKAMRGYIVFSGKFKCFRRGETEYSELTKGSKFKVLCGSEYITYWEYLVEVPEAYEGWCLGKQDTYLRMSQKYHKVSVETMVKWVTTDNDRCKYIPSSTDCINSCDPCIGKDCPFKEVVVYG